jgi:hypothetical protein
VNTAQQPQQDSGATITSPGDDPPYIDLDTAKMIADLAGRAYAEENDRFKSVESKVGTLLGATGAGLLFLLGSAAKPPDFSAFKVPTLLGLYVAVVAVSLVPLLVAELCFFIALFTRTFQRVSLTGWVTYAYLAKPQTDVLPELASTYDRVVTFNTIAADRKIAWQKAGLVCLMAGLSILSLGMVAIMVILFIHRPL